MLKTSEKSTPVVKVNLGSTDRVKEFVKAVSKLEGHFDLISGRYMVDAKSILGIFSMNYKEDVDLRIMDASDDMDAVMTTLQPYLV